MAEKRGAKPKDPDGVKLGKVINNFFYDMLEKQRKALKISKKDFSKQMGAGVNGYGSIKRGDYNATIVTSQKWVKNAFVAPEYLLIVNGCALDLITEQVIECVQLMMVLPTEKEQLANEGLTAKEETNE